MDFVLVCQFVQSQPVASDTGVHLRTKIGVIFDDVTPLGFDALYFSGLKQFTEHFHFLPLNFCNKPVLLLCFSNLDFFNSLEVLISDVFFPFDNGLLYEFQIFRMKLFDLIFFF